MTPTTKASHTPGLWHLRGCQVLTSPRNVIAETFRVSSVENQKANARLIAAAPCLLEALRAIIDYAENEASSLHELRDSDEAEEEARKATLACEHARAAIAKATGGER